MVLHHAAWQQQQQDAEAPLDPKDHHPLPRPASGADHDHDDARNHADASAAADRRHGSFSWLLTLLGFLFLTFNSGMAIYRSNGERGTVFFVVFSYLDLVVLYWCLRRYEFSEPGSVARGRLKAAVWLLTTALTLLFSSKVAAVMPPLVAVVVWLMAFVTVAGGFYSFFCYNGDDEKG